LARDDVRINVARRLRQPPADSGSANPEEIFDDTISIKSVTPEELVEGQKTEVAVTVAYELLSRAEGQINLGYSEGRGSGYAIIAQTRVAQGAGEAVVRAAVVRARVVPTRTGQLPFTKLFVNLSEYPHRKKWIPLASDSHTVEIR
jgi:hypothetical protein